MELSLTKREKEIYDLLLDGLSREEIAAALFIEPETTRTHMSNIYHKKGVRNIRELLGKECKKFRHILSRYEANALKSFEASQYLSEQVLKLKAENEKLNVMLSIRDKQIERLTDERIKNEIRGRDKKIYQNFTESRN